MYFNDYLELSWGSITLNKLRTFLSILGIAIGTAAVLSGIILGIGNRESIMQKLGGFGVNNLWFYTNVEEKGIQPEQMTLTYRPLSITREDVDFIRRNVSTISEVAPFLISPVFLRGADGKYHTIKALGLMLPDSSLKIYRIKLLEGRFISDLDQQLKEKVCVIERSRFSDEIFGVGDPIGKYLEIGQTRFRVIGLVNTLIYSFGYPELLIAFFPASSLQEVVGTKDFSAVNVLVKNIPDVPRAADQLKKALIKRFGLPSKFVITEYSGYVNTALDILNTLTFSIIGIAIISLTVGGIGIMNIIFDAVAERTREIGVIKALGARKREVLFLFLIESIVLAVIGGALGVILSVTVTKTAICLAGLPCIVPLWAVVLSFSLSVLIGIASGSYPARRAAELDPVEALRYG